MDFIFEVFKLCGIACYLKSMKDRGLVERIIRMLEDLEYRGYDSVGIGFLYDEKVFVKKTVGSVKNFKKSMQGAFPVSNVGIGHTRWATHGEVSDVNAHPHTDCFNKIALVHNGTIENFISLKNNLAAKGHRFKSETDTEIIAHLVEDFINRGNDIFNAFKKTVKELQGSFAIAMITNLKPGTIFFAKKFSPLVIGIGEKEYYLASDVTAFLRYTNKVIFLDDGDIGYLSQDSIFIENIESGEIKKPEVTKVPWSYEAAMKGGYPHFMLKEIFEQPSVVKNAVSTPVEIIKDFSSQIASADTLYLVAAGTSYHASMVGEIIFRRFGIPAQAIISSEFIDKVGNVLTEEDLVIGVSQSGETADTLTALRFAKSKKVKIGALTNVVGSAITRIADKVVYLNAGPEIGVAATKTYVSQIASLSYISYIYGGQHGFDVDAELNFLKERLQHMVKVILSEVDDKIKNFTKKIVDLEDAFFVAGYDHLPTALEGALKLKEISYIHAEGVHIDTLLELDKILNLEKYLLVFIGEEATRKINEVSLNSDNLMVISKTLKGLQVPGLIIDIGNNVPRYLEFIPYIIPLQLLSYYASVFKGFNPDRPRNLAKSVTVE